MKTHALGWLWLLLLTPLAAVAAEKKREGTPLLPETRVAASPANAQRVRVNPPPLLWPVSKGSEVRYAVRLSQDPQFPPAATVGAEGLRWAMFNPHVRLAPGPWYWQYAVVERAGKPPVWSEVFRFEVAEGIRPFVTPPPAAMLAACPAKHPRVLVDPAGLAALRKRLAESPATRDYLRHAENFLGGELPDLSKAQPKTKGSDAFEQKNFAKWASKAFAGNLADAVRWLVPAYLASGDDRVGRELARRGLYVADLDPNGVTAPGVSDFADGSCMRAMALAYDACYDLLSPAERGKLCDAMRARGNRFFQRTANRLESRLSDAHVWQHILVEFTELAMATRGDLPEADDWLAYVYELWVNRFPVLGGDEGGWAEGISYFGTNVDTLLAAPMLWQRLTGFDFFDHPWYRNIAYFHLYVWPPNSASDGFGDGTERGGPPSLERGSFFEVLAQRFGNPHAQWYAERVKKKREGVVGDPLLYWRWLELVAADRQPTSRAPDDLPQARNFPDVGIVSMHTKLADASNDLMLSFRSSPYGAHNHAHACQNALNLNFAGQRLFANSGYYIAYGDKHYSGWYNNTRGHNTVLIDGQGQPRGSLGYGQVLRFLDGPQISYCLGDASSAYPGTGLTRFRRQVALLRPDVVVVYDDLVADHAAGWQWLLHCPSKLEAQNQQITAATAKACAQVALFGSQPLAIAIDNRFDPPALNWREKKEDRAIVKYPDQWHATVAPKQKCWGMRYLAVFQVRPGSETQSLTSPTVDSPGQIRIGPWRIEAVLNAAAPASLVIQRDDGSAALAADRAALERAGKRYELRPSDALLIENGGQFVRRCSEEAGK